MTLAEYQVRLLLCAPNRKELLHNGDRVRLHWACGCSACELSRKRYDVDTCEQHALLLADISEGAEPQYDGMSGDTGSQRAWLRFAASPSMRNT
jgi:hypothetical protein